MKCCDMFIVMIRCASGWYDSRVGNRRIPNFEIFSTFTICFKDIKETPQCSLDPEKYSILICRI